MIDFAGLAKKGNARKKALKRVEEEKTAAAVGTVEPEKKEYFIHLNIRGIGEVTCQVWCEGIDKAEEIGYALESKKVTYCGACN